MCLTTITTQGFAEKKPEIVSTILPIHLLASEIAGEQASSQLLIPATQNLHHFKLKPSTLRTINNADLIIRVSPTLERFLNKNLEGKNVLTWMSVEDVDLLTSRTHHFHDHDHHDEHDHGKHNDKSNAMELSQFDSHIWFNPNNARLLIDQIVVKLSKLDAAHAKDYAQNAEGLKNTLKRTEEQIIEQLGNKKLSYAVFHDAWHYFRDYFGVTAPRTLKIQEDIPASAKQVAELRKHLATEKIACLIASPQSNQALLKALVEGKATRIVILDPKGAALPESLGSYSGLLAHTAEQLRSCQVKSNIVH